MRLPALECPECARTVESAEFTPIPRGGPPNATNYLSCLRKCDACGLGFSNANTAVLKSLTIIYSDPFRNIPLFISNGHTEALKEALNVRNRTPKAYKFLSSKSEDHVTWTIFRYLAYTRQLAPTMRRLKGMFDVSQEPALLLWGVPIPFGDPAASHARERVEAMCDSLGEPPISRSEPDVILDFGDAGVAFVEVKLWSRNDSLDKVSPKWDRYLEGSDAFADRDEVKCSGLYELSRNWRIAFDFANGRPATLINLGPESLSKETRVRRFRDSLTIRPKCDFLTISWREFLASIPEKPEWLISYIADRKVLSEVK